MTHESAEPTPLGAEVVYWANESGGKVHVGARIGRGPLLTAEACQHDQAGDDVTEIKAADARAGELGDFEPCLRCLTPALEV